MKKILIIITIFVISIVSIVFMKYTEYTKNQKKILNFNKEFLIYENSTVQINNIVTLMNKAIAKNTENNIQQDEKKLFKENDTNSIKIYIETKSSKDEIVQIPMEELMLNEKTGPEKVEYAFSDLKFEMTQKEYHKKTGQIKKIIFTVKN